jgi:type VI secretion system secreted protein Hcp
MAVDIFLELDGIKGESQDKKHKDKIDILAWSWGASQSGSAHVGGGVGTGKVNVNDFSFTKYVDKCSPTLVHYLTVGKHIAKGQLIVRKAGDKPLEYMKVDFKDLIVSSWQTGGSGGEDKLTENLSINFAEFKITYTMQNADGSAGTATDYGFNISQNAKV